MSQNTLTTEWLNLLIDPYAILGVSVNADERQISKRYYVLAKQLHPDNYINNNKPDQKLAQAVFTQLINPAYEQLKQSKKRLNTIAILRSEAKILDKQKAVGIQVSIIQAIATMSAQEAELFYEDAVKSYATAQYHSLRQAYQVTQQLSALNIVYLSCQKPNRSPSNESQPIIPQPETKSVPKTLSPNTILKPDLKDYAIRHYERAVEYSNQEQWNLAVQELRDAIKLEPANSDYYALLGVVHFQQKFVGMAKVYIRQALKINPKQPLALKYAELLQIQATETSTPQSIVKALGIASLLNKFLSK
ncbi:MULTISPECIES: DnaJ domain-containing protein [unclassified Anabaena]|uniref:J domain-containing protein n=1 Tax=unclassified Anabaena TaxID=2619674 RepID=UPI001445D932|nr:MULTISPECIES: DnaJ domain-containing protein [unclassified Anabaena]MTJ07211.1 molecular chaperone DnaJ [Anabaena sp. UHCC 0204]MTJ55239.1 molecular chaperone DnaJ [Anabaena sp. UHCC 0253]